MRLALALTIGCTMGWWLRGRTSPTYEQIERDFILGKMPRKMVRAS